ncbi:MAG: hypothetical protein OXR68_00710 [Alphaproteobacteria bacterium]|nr:hypothetical protein [Alphaproteobacteria bacterium]MDD9919132.1 hypothetical protein [Alphaproteobacteria bacterium]
MSGNQRILRINTTKYGQAQDHLAQLRLTYQKLQNGAATAARIIKQKYGYVFPTPYIQKFWENLEASA